MVIKIRILLVLLMSWGGALTLAQESAAGQAVKRSGDAAGIGQQSYRIINPEFSPSGRWIVAKKFFHGTSSSLVVLDTERKNAEPVLSSAKVQYHFTDSHHLLLADTDTLELWDLKLGTKRVFGGVKGFQVQKHEGAFSVLSGDGTLRWYSPQGEKINELTNVSRVFSDSEGTTYAGRETAAGMELWTIKGSLPVKRYGTRNSIARIEKIPYGGGLAITEKDAAAGLQTLVLAEEDAAPQQILSVPLQGSDIFQLYPMRDGKLMMVHSGRRAPPPSGGPQILYTKDHDVEATLRQMKTLRKFWVWNGKKTLPVPLDETAEVIPTGHERYVLNYNPTELQDYLTFSPKQKLRLLDLETGKQYGMGTRLPHFCLSPDGRFMVFKNDAGSWQIADLYDPLGKSLVFLEPADSGLNKPLFTHDNTRVLLESADGVWQYSLKTQKLTRIPSTAGYTGIVVNRVGREKDAALQNGRAYVDLSQPVVMKLTDLANNMTTYVAWNGKKVSILIPPTGHSVQYFTYSGDRIVWTQEYYNSAPKLMYSDRLRRKPAVILENTDISAAGVRREVIRFTGSAGEPLKGILYYPTHYSEVEKYPMVVHVYQVQNQSGSGYIRHAERIATGIDIRLLQDNGYFVFLPDTVVNPAIGSGRSALFCVHAALDAVHSHKGIDRSRIGLAGHSFGGYETNFIATQSDRFAAFISGAGISDIIDDYFSVNWHYTKPSYWKLETNQHDFRKDFAAAKELYTGNNPMWYVDQVERPMLLWTGKKDFNVHWEQTVNFSLGLRRYSKTVVTLLYPESRHNLNETDALDFRKRALEWWDYWLKGMRDVEWIQKETKRDAG